ncbi:DUF3303 domain-containing protein [Candidatus Binatus soli]|jgi:hypothetical protein|uniref:DUF3303 domain-containing protein n=1 Tax=Candidatus Binatus soli TaxID=1953413 RepID=UPI003C1DFDB7
MLYIAFIKNRPGFDTDIIAKSRKWWNEGAKPAGLKTIGFYGPLSSDTPDVLVFESSNHNDIRTMIEYWRGVSFEIYPAVDMAQVFRAQGMEVS